jgi:hypothetical protein
VFYTILGTLQNILISYMYIFKIWYPLMILEYAIITDITLHTRGSGYSDYVKVHCKTRNVEHYRVENERSHRKSFIRRSRRVHKCEHNKDKSDCSSMEIGPTLSIASWSIQQLVLFQAIFSSCRISSLLSMDRYFPFINDGLSYFKWLSGDFGELSPQ